MDATKFVYSSSTCCRLASLVSTRFKDRNTHISAQTGFLRIVVAAAIDYLRWTQLTLLILTWAIAVGAVLLIAFASYEDRAWSLLGESARFVTELPVVGPIFLDWIQTSAGEDGVIELSEIGGRDVQSLVLGGWAVVSAVFAIGAWLTGLFFRPLTPWPLPRKLKFATILCCLIPVGFTLFYLASPDRVGGGFGAVMFTACGLAVIYFLVSAWCLSLAHLLGRFRTAVLSADISPTP